MIKIKKKIIADISNIAHYNSRGDQPKLKNIDLLFSTIPMDIELIGIADRSLYHQIDNKERYKKEYLIPKLILEAPPRSQADNFILTYAVKNDFYFLSNDRFEEYFFIPKEWLDTYRISFMIINDELIFQRPKHLIFETQPEHQNEVGIIESDEEIIEEL